MSKNVDIKIYTKILVVVVISLSADTAVSGIICV
jgi:hypothetical protein